MTCGPLRLTDQCVFMKDAGLTSVCVCVSISKRKGLAISGDFQLAPCMYDTNVFFQRRFVKSQARERL